MLPQKRRVFNKKAAILLGTAGVTALIWLGAYLWVKSINSTKPETELRGSLVPAGDPLPANPCHDIPRNAMILFFGNSAAYTEEFPHTILRVKGESLISIDKTPEGITLSAKIFSADGKIVAELVDNEFHINPNNYFRRERPDLHTLVVYDQQARPVLKVRFLNPRAIKLLGTFHYPNTQPVVIEEEKQIIATMVMSRGCFGNNRVDINIE